MLVFYKILPGEVTFAMWHFWHKKCQSLSNSVLFTVPHIQSVRARLITSKGGRPSSSATKRKGLLFLLGDQVLLPPPLIGPPDKEATTRPGVIVHFLRLRWRLSLLLFRDQATTSDDPLTQRRRPWKRFFFAYVLFQKYALTHIPILKKGEITI